MKTLFQGMSEILFAPESKFFEGAVSNPKEVVAQ
jgi:hypothetical protein